MINIVIFWIFFKKQISKNIKILIYVSYLLTFLSLYLINAANIKNNNIDFKHINHNIQNINEIKKIYIYKKFITSKWVNFQIRYFLYFFKFLLILIAIKLLYSFTKIQENLIKLLHNILIIDFIYMLESLPKKNLKPTS